jgi:hypothetical protein
MRLHVIRRSLPSCFFTARPQPDLLPDEKERLSSASCCDYARPVNPVD